MYIEANQDFETDRYGDITEQLSPKDHRVMFTATDQEGVPKTKVGPYTAKTMSKDEYVKYAKQTKKMGLTQFSAEKLDGNEIAMSTQEFGSLFGNGEASKYTEFNNMATTNNSTHGRQLNHIMYPSNESSMRKLEAMSGVSEPAVKMNVSQVLA